jgi:hypothetical protein
MGLFLLFFCVQDSEYEVNEPETVSLYGPATPILVINFSVPLGAGSYLQSWRALKHTHICIGAYLID